MTERRNRFQDSLGQAVMELLEKAIDAAGITPQNCAESEHNKQEFRTINTEMIAALISIATSLCAQCQGVDLPNVSIPLKVCGFLLDEVKAKREDQDRMGLQNVN